VLTVCCQEPYVKSIGVSGSVVYIERAASKQLLRLPEERVNSLRILAVILLGDLNMRGLTNFASLGFVVLCTAFSVPTEAQAQTDNPQLTDRYRTATTYLTVRGASSTGEQVTKSGTGFIISDEGYAITAAHLFQDKDRKLLLNARAWGSIGETFDIRLPTGTILPIEYIRSNSDVDIALIKLPSRPRPGSYNHVRFCEVPMVSDGSRVHTLSFSNLNNFFGDKTVGAIKAQLCRDFVDFRIG